MNAEKCFYILKNDKMQSHLLIEHLQKKYNVLKYEVKIRPVPISYDTPAQRSFEGNKSLRVGDERMFAELSSGSIKSDLYTHIQNAF